MVHVGKESTGEYFFLEKKKKKNKQKKEILMNKSIYLGP